MAIKVDQAIQQGVIRGIQSAQKPDNQLVKPEKFTSIDRFFESMSAGTGVLLTTVKLAGVKTILLGGMATGTAIATAPFLLAAGGIALVAKGAIEISRTDNLAESLANRATEITGSFESFAKSVKDFF